MRYNLLLTGLAFTLAFLAGPSTPAQAPRPVEPPRSEGIQPATASKDSSPQPAAAAPKDNAIKPGDFRPGEGIKPASKSDDPTLHRMEIISGPIRNVHYYAVGGTPSEQATLNRLSQAENELAYQESLLGIKQQYANTESLMEARRREVQRKLYGLNMDDKVSNTNVLSGLGLGQPSPWGPGSGWTDTMAGTNLGGAFGSLGSAGPFSNFAGAGTPGALGTPATLGKFFVPHGVTGTGATTGSPGATGFGSGLLAALAAGGGFGGGAFPLGFGGGGGAFPFLLGQQGSPWSPYNINKVTLQQDSSTSQSLAHGIGDEGKFKTAMVMEMARQGASPDSTSAAIRNLEAARREVGAALFAAHDDRERGMGKIKPLGPFSEEMTPPMVEVTLRGGEKISGNLLHEDAEWIKIRTNDSDERIRLADVTRVKRPLPKKEEKKEPK